MTLRIIICSIMAACLCSPGPAQVRRPKETLPQQAEKHYATAMSQFQTKQYKQVGQLLDQFVKMYPTHENVPLAYLQLAYCRQQTKDWEGWEEALDQVIRRFYGSVPWFRAYGAKLERAKATKDHDKYLAVLAQMVQQARQAPLTMSSQIGMGLWHYRRYAYDTAAFTPVPVQMGRLINPPSWVMDVVDVADSPERAQQALKALSCRFDSKDTALPVDWEFAHVLLLRKAGKAEEADKAFEEYADAWGDDPRGMGLWLLRAADARRNKDSDGTDVAYRQLVQRYGGCQSLQQPLRDRMAYLAQAGRYKEFTELFRHYCKAYASPGWPDALFGHWVAMAQPVGENKQDTSRITEALEVLDTFTVAEDPGRQYTVLGWKIELYVRLGKFDEAASLAEQLVSDKHWSAGSYAKVKSYAARHEAFKKVIEAAEKKWSIPAPDPQSKAAAMLKDLQARLKEDQTRHAEEIGEEMFGEHRSDAATIEAVRALADYYYRKVMREPRDKWMERMVKAYPYHPLTQAVLWNKCEVERTEKRSRQLLASLDMLMERFPSAPHGAWYRYRLACYDAVKDAQGKLAFVRLVYGKASEAGGIHAIDGIGGYEEPEHTPNVTVRPDFKGLGDYWVAWARKFPGTRTELHCFVKAWSGYYGSPRSGFWQNRRMPIHWDEAIRVIQALQAQQLDPELRWKLAFDDINLLAQRGDGAKALPAVEERLDLGRKYRDLSLQLDMAALGKALANAGKGGSALALAAKLKRICYTERDSDAIDLMLANTYLAAKQRPAAARQYLKIVNRDDWPALRDGFFTRALAYLRSGGSPSYPEVIKAYLNKIATVQEFIPRLYYDLGVYYLNARNPAVWQVRQTLASRYPASSYLDRLDEEIQKVQAQQKKK